MFYLRMAWRSLLQSRGLTAVMIAALSLGIGIWYVQHQIFEFLNGKTPAARDGLYLVALERGDLKPAERPSVVGPLVPSILLTPRDARGMAGSTTHRHAITFATSALAEHEGRAETLRTRYTTRDLFELFAVPFAEGGTWSLAGDNGDALDVAVIDERVARRWFGDASAIGRRVRIDGADVRVVGVVAAHYDDSYHLYERLVLGRDDIYLPLAHATAAKARPDFAHAIAGGESGYISAWVELPTPTDRVAFVANAEQYLARERASGRRTAVPRSVTLRSSAEWRMVYAPGGAINVWPLLTGLCLATSIINLVRMLMAKFAGRSHDLGLLRAFGARRRAVMGQLLLEAVLIGVAAAVIGLLLGLLMMPLAASTIERTVAGAPTTISITAIAVTLAASIGAALLAALYPAWHLSSGTPAKQLRGR